jgi:hypothetical protein
VDQDVVRILEDSVLSFDRLTAVDTGANRVTETELDLRTGAIFGAVKKQAAASRFEVKIPNGVAGVRGTYIGANTKTSTFACIGGSIVVGYTKSDGTSGAQPVGSGYQFNTLTGEMSPIAPGPMRQFDQILDNLSSVTVPSAPQGLVLGQAVDMTVNFVSTSAAGSQPSYSPPVVTVPE